MTNFKDLEKQEEEQKNKERNTDYFLTLARNYYWFENLKDYVLLKYLGKDPEWSNDNYYYINETFEAKNKYNEEQKKIDLRRQIERVKFRNIVAYDDKNFIHILGTIEKKEYFFDTYFNVTFDLREKDIFNLDNVYKITFEDYKIFKNR